MTCTVLSSRVVGNHRGAPSGAGIPREPHVSDGCDAPRLWCESLLCLGHSASEVKIGTARARR